MKQRNSIDNPAQRPEVRAKMSAAHQGNNNCQGRVLSAETKGKISAALTGRPNPQARAPKSTEHKERLRQVRLGQFTGADNFNWRGGTSPRDWKADRYRQFLRAVWARDRATCQGCGTTQRPMHVHHIQSWIAAPDLRYEPDNGILLCPACHEMTTDPVQLNERARAKIAAYATRRERDEAGRFTAVQHAATPE